MAKINLAVYWAAACGGCDVALLDVNERILDIAAAADLVFWPIALDFKVSDVEAMPEGCIDVCLFSGAIRSSENAAMAALLRSRSKLMVALGACAHLGGIPGLANLSSRRDLLGQVYRSSASTVNPEGVVPRDSTSTPFGELELPALEDRVRALDQVVAVDAYIPGCPPPPERLWQVVETVLGGGVPDRGAVVGATDLAVCEECSRRRGEKRISEFRSIASYAPEPDTCLLEQGVLCCGPATRGGCGASCAASNMPCRGCSGPLPGVADQGAKLLSAIASVIDASEEKEIERIVAGLEDPAGTLYRFGLPTALLGRFRNGGRA